MTETENYNKSIKQLSNNEVNCFPRGLSEIYIEQDRLKNRFYKDFSVANNFFFQYYAPENFYVAKKNIELRNAIKKGLDQSLKSGKLLCIYKKHYGDFIKKANLKKANKIVIGNDKNSEKTKHSKYYLDFTKNYADIFKDIEKEQKTSLTPSECDSLFNELRS